MKRFLTLIITASALAAAAQETTFSGNFIGLTTWEHAKTVGASTLKETVSQLYNWRHTSGTNDYQMNALVTDYQTLAAGSTNVYNLAAAQNGFGDIVHFQRVGFLAVIAASNNVSSVRVGGAASSPFAPWAAAASDAVLVPPGGMALFIAPSTNGYTVGSATNLAVANVSAATNAAYSIYIGGVQ